MGHTPYGYRIESGCAVINEEEAAKKLLKFCEDNDYEILDDYICEELTEFNVFNESNRNMFLRLQVRIGFKK